MNVTGFQAGDLLLPRQVDLTKWSVVACDQYTSQPEYWEAVDQLVGSAPSSLRLILPEALRSFADYRMLAYSVALIVVMIFKPSGLFGRYEFSLANILAKLFGKKTGKKAVEGGVK